MRQGESVRCRVGRRGRKAGRQARVRKTGIEKWYKCISPKQVTQATELVEFSGGLPRPPPVFLLLCVDEVCVCSSEVLRVRRIGTQGEMGLPALICVTNREGENKRRDVREWEKETHTQTDGQKQK